MDFNVVHAYVEQGLTWIGFGVVCGLLAKAILPGRDPGGAVVTLALGIGGALIGGAAYAWALGERLRDLISPVGFSIATAGALVLLVAHRMLSGRWRGGERVYVERQLVVPTPQFTRRRSVRYSDVD